MLFFILLSLMKEYEMKLKGKFRRIYEDARKMQENAGKRRDIKNNSRKMKGK